MSRAVWSVVLAWAALSTCALGFAGRNLDVPGLYYDEAIQATPAAEFLRPGGRPLQVPGARSAWLFGGWFPVLTQPYMGALKSQLLIPVFAAFGADSDVLRLTTLMWGCLALLAAMGLAARLFGAPVAIATGVLLASDPSFVFASRHDWGSGALALLLRCAGFAAVASAWPRRAAAPLFGAGLLLGLGIYNKIDFAAALAGAGLGAAAAVSPGRLVRDLRAAPRAVAALAAGLALGAAPILAALADVLAASRGMAHSAGARGSDFAEKLAAWRHVLDGSYFHRLLLSGGSFERMSLVPDAASGALLAVCLASAAWLALHCLRREREAGVVFALVTALATFAALLAIPRASRIHHVLNVYPFPHLLVAVAAAALWRERRLALRALAVAGVGLAVAGSLRVDGRVLATALETGGSGRWTGAVAELGRALPPGVAVTSLDWGFDAPLRLLRPDLELDEPVWRMFGAPGATHVLRGEPGHVVLVWAPGFEVFPFGTALVAALRLLPPGAVEVTEHTDRLGAPAFVSVRFARRHELVYRGGFEVRLR
jgi:hypothetical protein